MFEENQIIKGQKLLYPLSSPELTAKCKVMSEDMCWSRMIVTRLAVWMTSMMKTGAGCLLSPDTTTVWKCGYNVMLVYGISLLPVKCLVTLLSDVEHKWYQVETNTQAAND